MSLVRPIHNRVNYLEEVLHKTGWGLYYKFLVGFTSFTSFTNAMTLLSLFFALPLATCDTLWNESNVIVLHACFNLGRSFGAFIICAVSDYYGKKCMIPKSHLLVFASCFIIAFSHNAYTLFLAVIFLGSGLEANLIITKVHLIEILPIKQRGFYIVFCDLIWTLGYFASASTTFTTSVTNTSVIEHDGMDMRLTFWRLLFALSGGLSITMACTSALLESSPRFLLYKKRLITATLTLKQFYAINKSKYSETFDVYSQDMYNLVQDYDINVYAEPVGSLNQFIVTIKIVARMVRVLFSRNFLWLNLTVVLIKLPGMFGTISLNIFLARNFNNANKNYPINGLDFLDTISYTNTSNNCTVTLKFDESARFLLFSLNIFVAMFFLMLIIDRVGRKIPIFMSLLSCSLASFVLAFQKNNLIFAAIASSIFTFAYAIIESSLNLLIMESIPTALRGTAVSQSRILSYFVVSLIYIFLQCGLQNFLITIAVFSLFISVLCQFLPETKQRPLVE